MFFLEIVAKSESPKLDLYNSSYGPFFGTATGCPVLTLYTVQNRFLIMKKREFRLVFFMEIIATSVNLM